jgi:hypothetical protein
MARCSLLAVAILIWRWPKASIYGVAAVSVMLIFIGIHNAWDIAVWNSLHRKRDLPNDPDI